MMLRRNLAKGSLGYIRAAIAVNVLTTGSYVLPMGFAALVVLPACSNKTSDRSITYVDAAKALPLHQKSTLEAKEPSAVIFVDPRPKAQFDAAHIAGATSITLAQANAGTLRVDPTLPRHPSRTRPTALSEYDAIIVYGNDPASGVALAMAKRLLHLGFGDVYVLRGGLKSWRALGGVIDEARVAPEVVAPGTQ
jgi:rhodanese-related sulfurtransferase